MWGLRGKKSAGLRSGAGIIVLLAASAGGLAAQAGARPHRPPPRTSERDFQGAFAEPRTPQELRRRLANLESEALPLLFQAAAEGSSSVRGGEPVPLSEEERILVRESLTARPRRELIPFLADLASREVPTTARLEAQRLLGSIGSADHLKLLARVTLPVAPEREPRLLEPELRAGFSAALSAILARDTAALGQIGTYLNESPSALSGSIVDGLASVPSLDATRCLAALLGRRPGLDPLLLTRLAERGSDAAVDESVREAVRRYLGPREATLMCMAARAAGEFRDEGAVEALMTLIDHSDEPVRDSAFLALKRISGLAFGSDATRWTSWYHAEMRWWEEEADPLLQRIERARGVEFVRASRLALEHRLFRDRIAEAFAQVLRRNDVEEVRLACRALEQLRSRVAIRGLIECLEHDAPLVREAAWTALRAITGVELPPEIDSWSPLAG